MTEGEEVYLGDGLYASFDGWQIVLRAPRETGDHWVGVEPDTLMAMLKFVTELPRDTEVFRTLFILAEAIRREREENE